MTNGLISITAKVKQLRKIPAILTGFIIMSTNGKSCLAKNLKLQYMYLQKVLYVAWIILFFIGTCSRKHAALVSHISGCPWKCDYKLHSTFVKSTTSMFVKGSAIITGVLPVTTTTGNEC